MFEPVKQDRRRFRGSPVAEPVAMPESAPDTLITEEAREAFDAGRLYERGVSRRPTLPRDERHEHFIALVFMLVVGIVVGAIVMAVFQGHALQSSLDRLKAEQAVSGEKGEGG